MVISDGQLGDKEHTIARFRTFRRIMKHSLLFTALASLVFGFMSAVASATPHCQPCPYSCADLGLGKKDCSFVSDSRGVCCVDLTKKGLDIAQEQEKLLGNKNVASGCPAGFKPSERRCSPEERKRGCRDQRVGPTNTGCVSANFR